MKYFIIGTILVLVVLFLLLYPFKIGIYNKSNYLHINISNFVILRLNLLSILNNSSSEDLKKFSNNNKVLKKIKIKRINIKLRGLNFNYRLNGAYYGLLCAIAGIGKKVCEANDVEFNYDLEYLGDKYLEFEGVVRAKAIHIIGIVNSI